MKEYGGPNLQLKLDDIVLWSVDSDYNINPIKPKDERPKYPFG
jgi:hypothetical protein